MSDMDEVVQEFLVESHENLDRLDQDLLALEQDPGATALLAGVFRTVHTIKGTCGFLGFSKLESVTHVGETLLARLRDGALVIDGEIATALLSLVDSIRDMLRCIEETGTEGDADYGGLIARLGRLTLGGGSSAPQPVDGTEPCTQSPPAATEERRVEPSIIGELSDERDTGVEPEGAVEVPRSQNEGRTNAADNSIRVDVGLLDHLMTLVGELVLARNQILQHTSSQEDPDLLGTSQRLNLITTELQERVMKTRMQPIGNLWNKLPRVVRDLSLACGKQVRVEMEGNDTELDRTILEAIKDPLTHVVRNSVDHGIEPPEQRVAAGKPAEGRLFLRAFHEGGHVLIEIFDDGAGISPEKIRARAVERGVIDAEQAAAMGERELLHLIFLPGFSTAQTVSNVSGRGVGMDVVKTNVERIGGTVDVQSRPGQGTLFKIKIPLTLAIIPALVVSSGGDRYAIPQVSLLELVRLDGVEADRAIEMVQGVPAYRLRGRLLPIVRLAEQLGVEALPTDAVNIVVLQADDRQFGLVVDRVNDTEEIVVRPLGHQLTNLSTYAGATIMGDGRVALILDVVGIARRAGVVSDVRAALLAEVGRELADADLEEQAVLVAAVGACRFAISLESVARLEELRSASVERAVGRDVVRYRGAIMPLIHLSDVVGERSEMADPEVLRVVVCIHGDRPVGLVVDDILDIVQERLAIDPSDRPGIVGSAVVQQRVTDLLDIPSIVAAVLPDPMGFSHFADRTMVGV